MVQACCVQNHGNYVYHDRSQVSLGTCALEDCAMTVLATARRVSATTGTILDGM